MASVLTLIQTFCPGLYADAGRSIYIETAEGLIDRTFYGSNYNLAVYLMSAHMYTLFHRPGGSYGMTGTLNNMKESDLSIGMGNISVSRATVTDAWLLQTVYGQQLQALKRSTLPGISVTGLTSVSEMEL